MLLVWNAWLTWRLDSRKESEASTQETSEQGTTTTIVNNTVNGYTTDLTNMVSAVQDRIVSVDIRNEDGTPVTLQSGSVYNADGDNCWILTSAEHVRDHVNKVYFYNGLGVDSEIAGIDEANDIAVLLCHPEFEVEAIPQGDSGLVKQGEYVVCASGRQYQTQSGSISFGVASMPGQVLNTVDDESPWICDVILSDINAGKDGNGAPLLNLSGEMIGMVSARMSAYDRQGAVCEEEISLAVREIMNAGSVERGYLGVTGTDAADLKTYQKSAWNMTLDTLSGVLVVACEPGSPAEAAGIRPGDVITGIDETDIVDLSDLKKALYDCAPGQQVSVNTVRGGDSISVPVTLS